MAIPVFPSLAGQSWPLTRAPIWRTAKQESLSGKETRTGFYTFPRYQWTTSFDLLRSALSFSEFQQLLGFINSLNGGLLPFYFTDPADNAVVNQEFGVGDGATTTFQLVRALGGFAEPVQTPVPTNVVVSAAGTIVPWASPAGAGNWNFGAAPGTVTFGAAPAPGAALTWTGTYYWLCRMDNDTSEFSNFMSGMFEVKKLSFTSIKL